MRAAGPIVAPLDIEAGGTWLGLNGRGVFVGLTNLRPDRPLSSELTLALTSALTSATSGSGADVLAEKTGARSRGEVVMAALDARSAVEAAAIIKDLEAEAYNPFQLLIADAEQASLTVYRDRPRTRTLEPGVHVIGNVEVGNIEVGNGANSRLQEERGNAVIGANGSNNSDQPRVRKLARIRERVEKLLTVRSRDLLEDLAEVCREHVDTDPFESTCVHVADRYGTRSSLLLELADDAAASRLWAADGPPCQQSFEDRTPLLRELEIATRQFGRS